MTTHTEAEARDRLPELIDRALAGERVVTARNGRAVAESKPDRGRLGRRASTDRPPVAPASVSRGTPAAW